MTDKRLSEMGLCGGRRVKNTTPMQSFLHWILHELDHHKRQSTKDPTGVSKDEQLEIYSAQEDVEVWGDIAHHFCSLVVGDAVAAIHGQPVDQAVFRSGRPIGARPYFPPWVPAGISV